MPKKPTEQPPMSRDEIEQLVVHVVKRELAALVEKAGERSQGTGSKVTKRTVSIPVDVWNQMKRECSGPASQHVSAALRLYLATRQTEPA